MSDKRPVSVEDFRALPVGPEFGCFIHEVSDLDRSRGFTVIGGKRAEVSPRCKAIKIPRERPTVAVFFGPTDPISFGIDGEYWRRLRIGPASVVSPTVGPVNNPKN